MGILVVRFTIHVNQVREKETSFELWFATDRLYDFIERQFVVIEVYRRGDLRSWAFRRRKSGIIQRPLVSHTWVLWFTPPL